MKKEDTPKRAQPGFVYNGPIPPGRGRSTPPPQRNPRGGNPGFKIEAMKRRMNRGK